MFSINSVTESGRLCLSVFSKLGGFKQVKEHPAGQPRTQLGGMARQGWQAGLYDPSSKVLLDAPLETSSGSGVWEF